MYSHKVRPSEEMVHPNPFSARLLVSVHLILFAGFVNVSWVLRKGNAAKLSGLQNLVAAGTKAEVNKNLVAAGTWTNLAPPRILVDLSCHSLEWIGVAAV